MKFETITQTVPHAIQFALVAVIIVVLFAPFLMAQKFGTLKAIVINENGARISNAIAEVFSSDYSTCIYSGTTDSEGFFRAEGIPEGFYYVEIKARRLRTLSFRIKMEAGQEQDLGYRTLGDLSVDCLRPGVNCHVAPPDSLPPTEWECIKGRKILRTSDGTAEVLEYEELQHHAIQRAEPQWPRAAIPGHGVSIRIVIGTDGKVICADDSLKELNPLIQPSVDASYRWRFQPILENGVPISAIGILEFTVPYSNHFQEGR